MSNVSPSMQACLAAVVGVVLLNLSVVWLLVVREPGNCVPTNAIAGPLTIEELWRGRFTERVGGEVIRCAYGSFGLKNGGCIPFAAQRLYVGHKVVAERVECETKFGKEKLTVSISVPEGDLRGFDGNFYRQRRDRLMMLMNRYLVLPLCLLISIVSIFKLVRFCKGN